MLTEYQQILMNSSTTATVKTDLQALKVLVKLGQPNRQLFADFFDSKDKKNPAAYIREYLVQQCASPMGLRMGDQVKDIVLRKARPNYHKTALLSAIGQAYFDLCLVVSIAQYCRPDTGTDLPYSEYLDIARKSVDGLFDTIDELTTVMNKIGLDWYKGDLKEVIEIAEKEQFTRELVTNRIDTAYGILNLWETDSVKYNETYESVSANVSYQLEISRAMKVIPYLLTVKRNKLEFIVEEVERAEQLVEHFSKKVIQYFVDNQPENLPGIEETRTYLARNKPQKSSLDELI